MPTNLFALVFLCRCGSHVYNHYVDCRDTDYYVCEDSITDVLALPGKAIRKEQVYSKRATNGYFRMCHHTALTIETFKEFISSKD